MTTVRPGVKDSYGVTIASLGHPGGHVYDGHYEKFDEPGQTGPILVLGTSHISTRWTSIRAAIVLWP